MELITAKFGGTSLADAEQIKKAAAILLADPRRRYAVVSAPGKRSGTDIKVTDLLLRCADPALTAEQRAAALDPVTARFREIAAELAPDFPLEAEIAVIRSALRTQPDRDYIISRGEYLNARLIAAYLGWSFVDAADAVSFHADGSFDAEETNHRLADVLAKLPNAVIPGFYGAMPDGTVKTFSRGGSDITGALVARAVKADLYENWTDVSGMLFTDPRIVPDPGTIDYISYRELRELSSMGASVLHEDAVFPVRKAGIPIHIRNTNHPEDPGTRIVAEIPPDAKTRTVTGVTGKKGFCSIHVEKSMMNGEVGFGARLLTIFAEQGLPFEHCPTGVDSMSVVVEKELFEPKRDIILNKIRRQLNPDHVAVRDKLSLVAMVGHGMIPEVGCAARIFRTLTAGEINVRMIDYGSSGLSIIIGIDEDRFDETIRRIYNEFR